MLHWNLEQWCYALLGIAGVTYVVYLNIKFILLKKHIQSLEEFLALETTVKSLIEVVRQEENIYTSCNIICSTFVNIIKVEGMCIFRISDSKITDILGEYFNTSDDKDFYLQHLDENFISDATQIDKLGIANIRIIEQSLKRFSILTLLMQDPAQAPSLVIIIQDLHSCKPNKEMERIIHQVLYYSTHLVGIILDMERQIEIDKLLQEKNASEKKAIELKEQLAQHIKNNEQRNEFLSIIAHEFRTPLNVISSSIRLLQINTTHVYSYLKDMAEKFKNALSTKNPQDIILTLQEKETTLREDFRLDKIDEQIRHINNYLLKFSVLIESTLNFANLESNSNIQGFNYSPIELNLKNIVDEAVINFQNLRDEVQIQFTSDDHQHIILFDKSSLFLILSNLLSNAMKFSKPHGILNIRLFLDDNHHSCLIIEDQGIGIPQENLDKIFNKFYRAHNAKTISGTGIGLYLVKKLVELNGGIITIESEVEKGTKLTLIFLNSK